LREMNTPRLSLPRLMLFAAPAIPAAAISFPIGAYLPPFYAAVSGLDLATIGILFMAARLFDLAIDPAMGALSDSTRTRWGRRKPWLAASIPVLLIGCWLMFFPAEGSGIVALGIALLVAYIGYTMLTITHYSWAADLADEYHERSRLQGAIVIASIAGLLTAMILPALAERGGSDAVVSRVEAIGWYALVLTIPCVLVALFAIPPGTVRIGEEAGLFDAARRLIKRGAFSRLLLADFIQGVAGGLLLSGFVFTADARLGVGDRAAFLLLVFMASGMVCVPLWLVLARRLRKQHAIALSSAVTIPFIVGLILMPAGNLLVAVLLVAGFGSTMGVWIFLTRSMVADQDELEFAESGHRQTGTAFALVTLSTKLGGALAVGLGFWLFDIIGFDPSGSVATDTGLALALITFGAPILGHLAIIILMLMHPNDQAALAALSGQNSRRALG
jgi:glycoside/pentoside/hexuronide:cation symporter, GPH family